MSASHRPTLAALFDIEVSPKVPAPKPDPEPQILQADAERIVTNKLAADGGRQVLLLVHRCPYCGHAHIHAGGTTRASMASSPRDARCIGHATKGLQYRIGVRP